MLYSRAAQGIHSGHRGNFGKPIQEGVPWDAAKPEGHVAPPTNVDLPECDCHLPPMESDGFILISQISFELVQYISHLRAWREMRAARQFSG